MVEQLAKDYSNYLVQANITKEINPICTSIDEMLTRLEEFQSLMTIVKNDSSITTVNNIPKTFACKKEFKQLCNRIDDLEKFISIVNQNLTSLEQKVSIAEEELGFNDSGIKGFLKPLLGKSKSDIENLNRNSEKFYEQVEIFKTSDYFSDTETQESSK